MPKLTCVEPWKSEGLNITHVLTVTPLFTFQSTAMAPILIHGPYVDDASGPDGMITIAVYPLVHVSTCHLHHEGPPQLTGNWLITSNEVNRRIKLLSARLLVPSYAFQWIELTEYKMRRIAS